MKDERLLRGNAHVEQARDRRFWEETPMEVIGLDHIYVTVSDFTGSEAFYDRVMSALGFRKGDKPIGGDRHAHYFNRSLQYTIRPAKDATRSHDPYATGLHHICFQVRDRAAVDEAYRLLGELEVEATEPADTTTITTRPSLRTLTVSASKSWRGRDTVRPS